MSQTSNSTEWFFIVDTEQYAGNFEREMGAYLTGKAGEHFSEWAESLAEQYFKETGDDKDESQFESILSIHDDEWERYVAIWPTPGWWNDGSGKHIRDDGSPKTRIARFPAYLSVALIFSERPTDEQLALLDKRAKAFPEAYKAVYQFPGETIVVTGTRLIQWDTSVTETEVWKG